MKLHLPKRLLTALIAAISFIVPAALTLGSAAWANSGLHNNVNYLLGGTGAGGTAQGTYTGLQETTIDDKITTLVSSINAEALTTFNLWADDSRNAWTNALVGSLRVQDGATINISESQWKHENGTVVRYFDELHIANLNVAGEGNATLNVSLASHNVTIDSVNGTLSSVTNAGNLTLGSVGGSVTLGGDITNTGTLTLRGNVYGTSTISGGTVNLVDFSNSGELTFDAVQASGVLGMTGSGNVTWESFTLAEGTILEYGKGANTLNIGALDKNVTLYLYDVEESLRSESGVNLGISLGEGQTLDRIKSYLSVDGLASDASFELEERDGTVYMTSTGTLVSGWDNHWGAAVLRERPTSSVSKSDLSSLTCVEHDSSEKNYMVQGAFTAGEVVSVELTDTGDYHENAIIVGGFATTTNSNSQGSVERDVWIKATAGQYKAIVGGNVADNWSSGSAAHFTGDTHILVNGATVGAIIGGTYRDGQAPVFTGDTYISVLSGDVKDFIFGAAANTHNNTTTFNGNTNIFVYVPLVNNAAGSTLGNNGAINAVVGGAGKIANNAGGSKSYINGNTSVTIDLSGYTGNATTFVKQIVGGSKNVADSYYAEINGNTYVNIVGKEGITFTKEVIGGSAFSTSGTAKINGSTNVQISGGSFSGAVVGGSYATANSTNTVGSSNVQITGGSFSGSVVGGNLVSGASTNTVGNSCVQISGGSFTNDGNTGGGGHNPYTHLIAGGSMLTADINGTSMSSDSTKVEITGGNIAVDIYGGHVDLQSQAASNAITATLQNATVTLNGADAEVANIYGGSFTQRDNSGENAVITQGSVLVDLIAGTVNGNVYAGGRQIHRTKITTGTTEVRISDAVTFTSSSAVVSGGYQMGCTTDTTNAGTNPSEVTGTKTLVFTGGSQDRSGITFDSFDTFDVELSTSVITIDSLSNVSSLNKIGAGTLKLNGVLDSVEELDIDAGVLEANCADDLTFAGAITGSGAFKKTGTGTLTLSGTNTYSGGTTISGGVLKITNTAALGTSTTSVAENASLLINTGNSGSVTFTSTNRVTGAGTMEIASGSTVNVGSALGDGTAHIQTNVKINGGATLNLTAQDALGWGDNATKKITLLGSGSQEGQQAQLAKLTATSVQTMKTSLDLQGNALVSGGSFEFFGGSITASGKNNVISSDIYSRNDGTITVTGEEDELEISGNFGQRSDFSALITKSGRGTLTISGANNVFHKGFTVGEGKVEVSGTGSTTVQGAALTVSSGAQMEVGANLTVSSTTELSGSMSVTGGTTNFNGVFTASGANASLSVSSGSATVNGVLNVTGENVSLSQSDTGVLNLNGSVTIAQNAGLTLNGTVGVGSTITNNGTLTFTDSITIIGELSNFDAYPEASSGTTSYVDDTDNVRTDGNGFEKVAGLSYWLTDKDSTGTVNYGTITHVSHGTGSYELHQVTEGKNLYFTVGSNVGNIFFVNEAGGAAVSAAEAARATGFELVAGGNLSLAAGAETNANATIRVAGASTIDLAAGSTLNTFTKEGDGAITLTGSGTYDLGNGVTSFDDGVSLGSSWTGTVTLSGITSADGMNLNDFGNEGSSVKLDGVKGWFDRTHKTGAANDKTVKTHIILGSGGIIFDDYSESGNYAFNKGISGTGNFVIDAKTDNGIDASPTILIGANSTSATWSGAFKVNDIKDNKHVQLYLNGNGAYFNGSASSAGVEMNDAGGKLKLFVGYATPNQLNVNQESDFSTPDTDSNGNACVTTINGAIKNTSTGSLDLTVLNNAVFNKEVTVTSMTVNEDKTATMNATLKAGTVTNNGVLKLGEAAEVTDGSMSKVQMDSAGITGTASGASVSNADVQIAQLAQDATFTIEDMTLTNTTITAASVNNVRFDNVTVEGRTVLKMQAAVQMPSAVGMGGTVVNFETSSYSGITLNTAVTGNTLAVDLGDLSCLTPLGPDTEYELSITLNGLQFSTDYAAMAEGTGVLFTQDSWLGKLLEGQGATQFVADAETGAPVGSGGGGVSVSYSAATGGNVGTIITITGLNVPEPTTATLSLLALTALAARRRRRA